MIDPTASSTSAASVYDGGAARPIVAITGAPALNASGSVVVAATAGLRTKILGYNIYPSAWTTEGTAALKDGAGGANLFLVARFTAAGQRADFNMGGQVICVGSVNTLVELNYTGQASIQFTVIYYQAP